MSITVQNLNKVYGTQKAVDNISFQVNKGEIVGFLGPNGAGKSTTMKIITGYLPADSGQVEVCGSKVTQCNTAIKKKIGYLPETNPLYYDMYVREYLEFIANVHKIPHKHKNRNRCMEEIIHMVGLAPEAGKKNGQLSKGYKQRVGLAAALLHNPEVLILDEPTSGLDPNQIIEIREVIKQLGKDKTVIFSSHILQEVEAVCNRVLIINKGRLVADDSLTTLKKANNNHHVVIVQFKEKVHKALLQQLNNIILMEYPQHSVDEYYYAYKLHTDNPEYLHKQIIELSLQQHLNIISLQSERQSLEAVFRSLTADS